MLQSHPTTDPLLQSFQLKHLRLKNRIISTSHAISYDVDGKPQERYQLYHEEKAKGGIGMTMFGGSSNIAVDSASVFGQLYIGDDSIIPYFHQFSERIHAYDCAIMCQITHMGRRTTAFADNWLVPIAPSRVREALHRAFPREMDRSDIQRVIKSYGDAAWRCKEGGLDGCEVIAASHLVGQFLSPHSNHRQDEFGGSLQNRARFGLMVLDEIRRRVGDDFIVGLRMPALEGGEGGLSFEDNLEIARLFESAGTVDFFNLNYGRMDTELALATQNMPGMSVPIAPFLETVGAFRAEVNTPILHAGRITDVATARHAIKSQLLDLVGMTRAHIADPHIVNKIQAGKEDRVRPCIGAAMCSSRRRVCIHNAATGREQKLSHTVPEATDGPRKVVVVGGGPAGLEAARVCALRGHKVTLLEAADQLGGQVRIASQVPWRRDLLAITEWLAKENEHLGVEVRCNCYAEIEDVQAFDPDVVILATGGIPDIEGFEGADNCQSTWDTVTSPLGDIRSAIVFDGLGFVNAATCADYLAEKGVDVTLVTSEQILAVDANYNERIVQRQRLYSRGVKVILDHHLVAVTRTNLGYEATFRNTLTEDDQTLLSDLVVVDKGVLPLEDLYHELKPGSTNDGVTDVEALVACEPQPWPRQKGRYELHRVGDAVAGRDVHAAIYDAFRLCSRL